MKTFSAKEILLPNSVDMSKWSVVSCDQFTSQPEYWNALREYVKDSYSTLDLIFPEVYLGDADEDERICKIDANMDRYITSGVFKKIENGYVLVERTTKSGVKRIGLVGAVDLEDFDFSANAKSVIRPTEGVVSSRIPPRLKIRKDASLELPHIMLLIDDPSFKVIEPIYENRNKLEKLYDFELNMGGGHLVGYKVPESEVDFDFLLDETEQKTKYGKTTNFVFAVGDGNHSLATAKTHWENVKKNLSEKEIENHPARFALVEINNVHSDGITFEPIHRVVFGVGAEFVEYLKGRLNGDLKIKVECDGKTDYVFVPSLTPLAISEIQKAIDEYGKGECDYIHGDEHLKSVAARGGVAIFMPKIEKSDLFKYVLDNGVLSRKSFSMGEAEEKRYYTEARIIK
ncbi:MAG: DUF1015 domain-containing protein [Eubacteriales bacterium]|nr:DUF1015 domain-containing protein [Eubacteriales bacterium]